MLYVLSTVLFHPILDSGFYTSSWLMYYLIFSFSTNLHPSMSVRNKTKQKQHTSDTPPNDRRFTSSPSNLASLGPAWTNSVTCPALCDFSE